MIMIINEHSLKGEIFPEDSVAKLIKLAFKEIQWFFYFRKDSLRETKVNLRIIYEFCLIN